jgi:hypothetical protein
VETYGIQSFLLLLSAGEKSTLPFRLSRCSKWIIGSRPACLSSKLQKPSKVQLPGGPFMNPFYLFVFSLLALSELTHAQTFTIVDYAQANQRRQRGTGRGQGQNRNEQASFAAIPADDKARIEQYSQQFRFDGGQCLFSEETIRSEFRIFLMWQYVVNPPVFSFALRNRARPFRVRCGRIDNLGETDMNTGVITIESSNETPDVLAHEILHWFRFDTVSYAQHGSLPISRDLVFACGMVGFTPPVPLDEHSEMALETCRKASVRGGRIVL